MPSTAVRRGGYRYTGDEDAAHDVLHDGFIKIFTHFTFRGECALATWVTRVMVTQAIDYLRKQKRITQLVVNEEQLPVSPLLSSPTLPMHIRPGK